MVKRAQLKGNEWSTYNEEKRTIPDCPEYLTFVEVNDAVAAVFEDSADSHRQTLNGFSRIPPRMECLHDKGDTDFDLVQPLHH